MPERAISSPAVVIMLLLAMLSAHSAGASVEVPERRKDQFASGGGYYVIPSPYSIPGIGKGFLVAGAIVNVAESYTDLYAFTATGDIKGIGLFGIEMHLVERSLLLDLTATRFNKATTQVYSDRGMDTDKDDYVLAELDRNDFTGARLTWTGWDRRLELYGLLYNNASRLAAIRDSDGSLIQAASDSATARSQNITWGFRLDFTDDYIDPRQGLRLESSLWHSPREDDSDPEYDIIELNLTGYIPLRQRDTLVLNYFQADAHVDRQGETDAAAVEDELGIDCSALSVLVQPACLSIVSDRVAQNRFGSVGALGGLSRLRAYPEDRFRGSHARFVGLEYRWNPIEGDQSFDFLIARDIRTVIQLAAFYERGAIGDDRDDLWGDARDAWGVGARLVTRSGLIFRADIATGDEGNEISIIFGYPWEVF